MTDGSVEVVMLICGSQVWGFEIIDSKRYYVRHVVVRKGDDWKLARLVYDFKS